MLANVIRKDLEQIFCQFDPKLEAADEVGTAPRLRAPGELVFGRGAGGGTGPGASRLGQTLKWTDTGLGERRALQEALVVKEPGHAARPLFAAGHGRQRCCGGAPRVADIGEPTPVCGRTPCPLTLLTSILDNRLV